MQETGLAAPCGLYCGPCEYLGSSCSGCGNVRGRPFWTETYKIEVCPIYGCCSEQKQLEHCGLCGDFPCETFLSLRDPSMSDEEAEQSLNEKKRVLERRREIGTEAWLIEIKG